MSTSARFVIYKGMSRPELVLVLKRNGAAEDVSGAAAVTLYVGKGAEAGRIVDGKAMTKDGATGQVRYAFEAAEAVVGEYLGQVEVTWAAGQVERSAEFVVSIRDMV